ncbi:MAG: hypothetical protein HY888_08245, partial [Deltaproteobacteria bacterium]|nr:hypothetical protein [Deltaproteobacteria bacterium]
TSDVSWTSSIPVSYTCRTWGFHTLYAYAKDAAGNVSAAKTATVRVGPVDGIIVPGPGKTGPALSDALKALNFALGLEIPTAADILNGDVAPLVNGVPHPDGKIDLGDVIVILRKVVGL